tara:strand:+ start:49 stop:279 length:231 start_codon:yes stop_codon:yes gene_type:complete
MNIFIGWRKLLFAIILTILASIFVYIKEVKFNDWANFMIWIYGSYATTNIGEYFGKRFELKNKIETVKTKKENIKD